MNLTPKQIVEVEKIKKDPDKPVSQVAYARYAGVCKTTINKQVKSGLIVLDKNKKVIPRQADLARKVYVIEEPETNTDLSKEMFQARLDEQKAKAILANIKVQEEQERLVPFDEVRDEYFKSLRMLRNQILSLPDRVGPIITGKEPHEVSLILRKEIELILETLSDEIGAQDS